MKSSSTMPTKLDETACNGFCQHPACWASSRRLAKHIPRVLSPVGMPKQSNSVNQDDDDDDYGLPSLKVVNMLDDYGMDSRDRYPSPDMGSLRHLRSNSLPSIPHVGSVVLPNPPPPTTSPSSNRSHDHEHIREIHSAPLKPVPPIKKVEVHEVFDWEDLRKDWTDTFVASKYYVWCPSQKYLQKKSKERELKSRSAKDSRQMKTKHFSGDSLPFELQKHTKSTKKSRRPRKTPSSVQPYTPRDGKRSQQQIQMVEIGPVENIEPDGLNELLSLPRDILIEVLQHTKQSDLLSKEKIHSILQKILPQLQFHQDIETVQSQANPGTSAVRNGQVLLNKKLTLLDSREKHEQPIDHYHPRALYYMDDQVLSRVSSANESEENMQMRRELEGQSLDYGTISPVISETTPRKKVTAITGGTSMDSTVHRAKVTSISTQSLPPLEPGMRATRPFMYKGNSMDLTLGPVPSPPRHGPSLADQAESLYSEKDASSIHVTMPTIGSTDRSALNTPVGFYHRSPVNIAMYSAGGLSAKNTASPMPSEDVDGTEDFMLHALSPSLSTHVPKPPNATPNTMPPKTGHSAVGKPEENWSPDQPLTPSNTPLVAPNILMTSNPGSPEKVPLRTITEANSEIPENFLYSPSPPPSLSVMPPKSEGTSASWSPALNSLIPQVSDKSKISPIQSYHTIVQEAPSPEPWPQVNERDYYNRTPDSSKRSAQSDLAAQKLAEQQSLEDEAPAPPPPSPEARDSPLKELGEENELFVNENVEVGKASSKTSSLGPLQEEGEEEEEEEEENEGEGEEGETGGPTDKEGDTVADLDLERLKVNDETNATYTDTSNVRELENETVQEEDKVIDSNEFDTKETVDEALPKEISQETVENQNTTIEQT